MRRTPGVELGRVEVLPDLQPGAHAAGADARRGDAAGHPALRRRCTRRHPSPTGCSSTRSAATSIRGGSSRRRCSCAGRTTSTCGSRSASRSRPGAASPSSARTCASALTRFLAPLDPEAPDWFEDRPAALAARPLRRTRERGWPLGKPVSALELVAVASRVAGVRLVTRACSSPRAPAAPTDSVPISGLAAAARARDRPSVPTAADLDHVRGQQPERRRPAADRRARPRRPGDVLMDANGTRYHLLLGEDDWTAAATPSPARRQRRPTTPMRGGADAAARARSASTQRPRRPAADARRPPRRRARPLRQPVLDRPGPARRSASSRPGAGVRRCSGSPGRRACARPRARARRRSRRRRRPGRSRRRRSRSRSRAWP